MGQNKNNPIRVGMVSLGCAKNLVDAEIMLGSLMRDGIEITNDPDVADVVIVNTCSFIDAAQEESIDSILEAAEARNERNPNQGLIVSGCLTQRFREELPKLLPEVDAFMGIDQVAKVGEIVVAALNRRKEKENLGVGSAPSDRRRKVIELIEDHDTQAQSHTHDGVSALRGTNQFGKTKTVVVPKSRKSKDNPPVAQIIDVTQRPVFIPDFETPRFRLTPKHFAYVKIAEGCNHPCSFCIIPRMRGSHRSRQQSDVVREVEALIADGVREINLISQDSTYYGLDLRENHSRAISSPEKFKAATKALPADSTTLCTLLRELNSLKGDFWIRLLYTHPAHWTDELIQTIAGCPKVAKYVDMPLQHIHETMLERMRRETSREYIEDLIRRIRVGIPGITLRTTFIVGFPGETETYFESLLKFIKEVQFERLGIFTYSHEEGTKAGAMTRQVSDAIKQRRREQAMAEQLKIAREVGKSNLGRKMRVLVEAEASAASLQKADIRSWEHGHLRGDESQSLSVKGSFLVARSEADAPDIDGRVFIKSKGKTKIGQFVMVRVIGHTDYDLVAEEVK